MANLQGIGDKVSVVRFGSLCVFAEFALLDKFSGGQVDFAIWGREWLANCSYEYAKRQRKWVVLWQNDYFKRMLLATLALYGMFRHFLTSFLPIFNFNNLFLQSLMNIFAIIIIIAGHFGRKMVKKNCTFLNLNATLHQKNI